MIVSFGNQTNNCLGVFSNYLIDYNLIVHLRNFGKTRKYIYWPIITKIWTAVSFKNRFIFTNFIQSAKIPFSNDKLNVCLVDQKVHQSNFGTLKLISSYPEFLFILKEKNAFSSLIVTGSTFCVSLAFCTQLLKDLVTVGMSSAQSGPILIKKMLNLFVARFFSKTSFGR